MGGDQIWFSWALLLDVSCLATRVTKRGLDNILAPRKGRLYVEGFFKWDIALGVGGGGGEEPTADL